MIYVPQKENYKCYVVQSEGVIRAYEKMDYYIRSNYIYRDGNTTFSSYSTLPICLSDSELTSEVYYRNDFDSILIIFLIMCIFCFYIPIKIFTRLFRRFN